jgi:uncharacterized membrane protein
MNESNSSSDIQRVSALSDGIFAVAMTLLAFSVHLPESSAIWSGDILVCDRRSNHELKSG